MFKKLSFYFAVAASIIAAACTPDFAHAQIINPNPPQVAASAIAGTGLSQAGAVLSVNYGLTAGTAMQGNNTSFTTVTASGNVTSTKAITASTNVAPFGMGTLTWSDTNIFGSWQTSANSFAQMVLQNSNNGATASTGYIVSNDAGTATTFYGEFGINSSGFTGAGSFNLPSATYLTSTSGDLAIGTTTANGIHFLVNNGATDALSISSAGAVTTLGNLTTSGTLTASNTTTLNGTISGTGITTYEANINHVQTVANIAALRALNCVNGLVYSAQGYYTLGDGGGGALYVCNSSDTTSTDNGGTILAAANSFRYYMMPPSQYNARQFGAKCDGATNDTTALQAAITASNGHSLYIPAGTKGNGAPFNQNPCLISSPLLLNATTGGYHIFGDSPQWTNANGLVGGTIIKNTSVSNTDAIQVTNAGNGQVVLRNFGILGNGSDGNGITVTGSWDTFIEKMIVSSVGKAGVVLTTSYDSHIYASQIGNTGTDGILVSGVGNGISIRDNILFNCDGLHGGYGDVRILGSGGNSLAPVVDGNTFEGGANTEFGLAVQNTNAVNIRGNYFEVIPNLLYMDATVVGFAIDANYFQDGLVTIASTSGAFTNNTIAKTSVTTTASINAPAGGGSQVFIRGNTTTGGATFGFPAYAGQATLVGGTVSIGNTNVAANSIINISRATASGTVGDLRIGSITAGTSFVISSSSASDTSVVNWSIAGN